MTNTSVREHEAETRIAHELLRYEILVAKPYFDKAGGDLLALLTVADGARFIRVQCKGRSLEGSDSTSVSIPADYVTDAFSVFLYLRHSDGATTSLYVFFPSDIRKWTNTKSNEYVLSISRGSFEKTLAPHHLNTDSVARIASQIRQAEIPTRMTSVFVSSTGAIYNDGHTEVTVEKESAGNWKTLIHDLNTGTTSIGTACPGEPDCMRYDPFNDTWTSRKNR